MISQLQCEHSVNTAPRTKNVCFFKPLFLLRLSISGDVISKTFTHDLFCAAMRSHMSEWNQSARSLLWRGQPNVANLLPVCTLKFVLGNKHTFLKKYTWMRACDALWVSLTESLQLPVIVAMLLLTIFLFSHVRGIGTEWKWYIAANCWLFIHQELCTVSWFRHFAKRTMLLHSLPVKYLCTLWGSINLQCSR